MKIPGRRTRILKGVNAREEKQIIKEAFERLINAGEWPTAADKSAPRQAFDTQDDDTKPPSYPSNE